MVLKVIVNMRDQSKSQFTSLPRTVSFQIRYNKIPSGINNVYISAPVCAIIESNAVLPPTVLKCHKY